MRQKKLAIGCSLCRGHTLSTLGEAHGGVIGVPLHSEEGGHDEVALDVDGELADPVIQGVGRLVRTQIPWTVEPHDLVHVGHPLQAGDPLLEPKLNKSLLL